MSGIQFRVQIIHLFIDASNIGWELQVAGWWSRNKSQIHINNLSLILVSHWESHLCESIPMIQSDNLPVVWYINKMGSTKSMSLLCLTFDFFQLIDSLNIQVQTRHIHCVSHRMAPTPID